jgi:antitoxin component YwqK of YwqJK toxin-antitoxin module
MAWTRRFGVDPSWGAAYQPIPASVYEGPRSIQLRERARRSRVAPAQSLQHGAATSERNPMIPPMNPESKHPEAASAGHAKPSTNTLRRSSLLALLALPSLLLTLPACGGGEGGKGAGSEARTEIVTMWFDAAETKKKFEGPVSLGQKEGEWTWWYDNGQIAVRAQFEGGEATGLWTEWHQNGQKKSEITWAGSETRTGPARIWYPNGRLSNEGTFDANVPVGVHTRYYPNGQLHVTETYVDGVIEGSLLEFYDTGAKKKEGELSANKQVGPWISYYPDGAKQSEGDYADDVQVGTWTFWHPTGEVMQESNYVDGKILGISQRLHPDGSLEAELTYVDGLLEGQVTQTYPDGKTRSSGLWKEGLRTGEWSFFHPDGSLDSLRSGYFEENQRVKDVEGEPVEVPGEASPPGSAGPGTPGTPGAGGQ